MMNTLRWTFLCCTFTVFLWGVMAQTPSPYSAADSLAVAELTLEEIQFYQADFFPLSLAEKGRQSAPAWRGMPPGYLDYQFDTMSLYNPLWGYWDNQFVPLELVRQREVNSATLKYRLLPIETGDNTRPTTRIAFSQDLQFGLSYLDANLKSYYRPRSYFRLSGTNFLRDGTSGSLSRTQITTYRGQIHHQLSRRWSLDLWYWQNRHKFTLASFPVATEIYRVSRVGHFGWLNINFQPDSLQSLTVTPYVTRWQDQYHTETYFEQRKTYLYSTGIKADYRKDWSRLRIGLTGEMVRHDITQSFVFSSNDLWDTRLVGRVGVRSGGMRLDLGTGLRRIPDIGESPEFDATWDIKLPQQFGSLLTVSHKPQMLPMSMLRWEGYSISPLTDRRFPVRQGATWKVSFPEILGIRAEAEPFYHQFRNAWYFTPENQQFVQRDFENSGIRVRAAAKLWNFYINEEINYSENYRDSFTPRINNILKVNLSLLLFNRALHLENFVIYHFIGDTRQFDYHPLTNQYLITGKESGNYHLLDVKILGHIKTATIFLIWENLTSQDYALVNDYWELYRLFRFGIYWTLFN